MTIEQAKILEPISALMLEYTNNVGNECFSSGYELGCLETKTFFALRHQTTKAKLVYKLRECATKFISRYSNPPAGMILESELIAILYNAVDDVFNEE